MRNCSFCGAEAEGSCLSEYACQDLTRTDAIADEDELLAEFLGEDELLLSADEEPSLL
jgi:hypothetical protein